MTRRTDRAARCLDGIVRDPLVLGAARAYAGACPLGMTVVAELLPGQAAQAPEERAADGRW